MADQSINELDSASHVYSSDLFVLEQNHNAMNISGATLIAELAAALDGHGGISTITFTNQGTSGDGQFHYGTITYADGTTTTFTVRDGIRGVPGQQMYVHIRYSGDRPISNTDMSDQYHPDAWMGIYSGTSATPPTNYTDYVWYKIKGDTGPGASLTGATILYQASSSGTTPTGTWQSTMPTLNPGDYLWTQVSITFDTGSPVSWTFVSYQGINGQGAVGTVNSVSPDAGGNVSLDATNIPYNSSTVAAELASLASGAASAQPKINASGMLIGTGSGVVSAATLGADYGAKSFTITLAANSWSSNAQTVNNANFLAAGFVYSIAPASSYIQDYKDAEIYADDITTDGQITFHCATPPSGGITVNVMRVVSA